MGAGFNPILTGRENIYVNGQILGFTILSENWYTPNQLMVLAPGAFFTLGIVIGVFNFLKGPDPEEAKK